MSTLSTPLLEEWSRQIKEASYISPGVYERFDIKRGLRNADGTGVMAGITQIGSVQGYTLRDGEKFPAEGKLYYRGMDVEHIVRGFWEEGRQGMAEVVYLLLFGSLPSKSSHDQLARLLTETSAMPSGWAEDIFLKSPSKDIMNMLARSVLALYAHDDAGDDTSLANMIAQCIRLIAVFPSIVSSAYAALNGYYSREAIITDNVRRTMSENFLFRLRPDHAYTEDEARLLDLMMVLHAEHGGGNNSTFTCRVLSSTGTDTYSAIAGAVTSLKGPLHGGANRRVVEMFREMQRHIKNPEDEDEIYAYLLKILQGRAGDGSGKIYGMGHAIYTQSDPRTVLLKQYARRVLETQGEEMRREYTLMEKVEVLAPQAFREHKGVDKVISANVDFYSGFIYRALGIPEELFTPLFAMARVAGWSAHRMEEMLVGGRIIRPAYKALELGNPYIPMKDR